MIKRLHKFLDKRQKTKSYILFSLIFLSSILEFLSIGLILPITSLFLDSNLPQLIKVFDFIQIDFKDDRLFKSK